MPVDWDEKQCWEISDILFQTQLYTSAASHRAGLWRWAHKQPATRSEFPNLGINREVTSSNVERRSNSREKTDGKYWERANTFYNGAIHIYKITCLCVSLDLGLTAQLAFFQASSKCKKKQETNLDSDSSASGCSLGFQIRKASAKKESCKRSAKQKRADFVSLHSGSFVLAFKTEVTYLVSFSAFYSSSVLS